jgi:hypothetical protein
MIKLKPLPHESSSFQSGSKSGSKVDLRNFTIRSISNGKINPKEMKWVAERVARILGEKGDQLTKQEIDAVIHSIRILLSKMQLLKARGLTKLVRKILNPGEKHTTQSNVLVFPRHRRTNRPRRGRKAMPSSCKKVA